MHQDTNNVKAIEKGILYSKKKKNDAKFLTVESIF